jgi:phosphodiesterase/alkaline phosphatase D-like protein
MLGRQTATSMGVWCRTEVPAEVRVRYGLEKNGLTELSEPVMSELERDNTARVFLKNLSPGTVYIYQLVVDGSPAGEVSRFRTLMSPEMTRGAHNPKGLFNFKFEYGCGNNQSSARINGILMPTYNTMMKKGVHRDVDFAVLNGDFIYEVGRDFTLPFWQERLGVDNPPEKLKMTPGITGVWENYKIYMNASEDLRKWHTRVPSYYTVDDHEILNDVYGSGTPGRVNREAVFRDTASQAWLDYIGWSNHKKDKSDIPDGVPMDDPNAGVYEILEVVNEHQIKVSPAFKADSESVYSTGKGMYGKKTVSNCDIFTLDTRTYREMHDTKNPAKKDLSMLGKRQLNWLMKEMKNSKAQFFFLFSSVNFMVPHIGSNDPKKGLVANKDDAWTVFLDEREKLIKFWETLDKPVFILTGDLHNSFAIKITDKIWEFASAPHNSPNHPLKFEGRRPVNGPFQYGPRPCYIRWSTAILDDISKPNRRQPVYCVVQVNNIFNNPETIGGTRWVAYPVPQVIFQYYSGATGELLYSETILAE